MTPMAQFEESARTIWRSDLGRVEKGQRLKAVRKAIVHYVERLDQKRPECVGDAWKLRSFERVRNYLTQLGADVEELALECEKPAKKATDVASGPYAA